MTSDNKSHISKSANKIETITRTNILKYILALDEESEKNSFVVTLGHLIELIALPIFLLYEVKHQCW